MVKNVDGERKITDTGDIVRIAGGEAGIVVLNEDGTLAMYVPGSDEWISQKDLNRIGPEGNIMQQVWNLVLSADNVEDIAYNGFNYLAVKVDGEWTDGAYNNRCRFFDVCVDSTGAFFVVTGSPSEKFIFSFSI